MSRIGKKPVPVPSGVTVSINAQSVVVKGPKGELSRILPGEVNITQEGEQVIVTRQDESRAARACHGLSRTLIANMVEGVSKGFEKRLEIKGVGYRAAVKGKTLNMNLGYSHPVEFEPPKGIEFKVENNTNIIVSGIDKELVGTVAAKIRDARPPEPYKGKGVRYLGEMVRRKAGKAGK
ncbi:50S ribosomal protein L6 [Leptolyngbyaceae cyanobacterium CCMR0082]|uniref:Large ribosomal subunit protein uL6 n=2 Tax=Adonisia turfae TaxID=2950184 RepID=A0A6M0S3F0_9CYAN|nr:50S ribosomal protein L6 [Adonisia turfae]MDV3351828.1 50S ribosomal protein L6 [Leptothoe sp. LEGE 181152]NEZ60534.1 50S ribosomal protein L6 [Adonisia turfae CCMR0081]NEZ62925.1 50S ribosomal protein L6 [Adonisia turfae CCMR0082]